MARKQYVIGIDGGGTKSAAMLADAKGNILAEQTAGPSNFQIIGAEKAAEVLLRLIVACCGEVGCSVDDIRLVVAGLSGAGRESDQERMRTALLGCARRRRASLQQIVVESDARIALEGAFKGKAGIVLVSGTGSIARGKDYNGDVHRVGGLGRLLGDEGSGYAIGRDGLNAVAKHLDSRGKETLLTKLIAKQFGLATQEQIISAVYNENFDIASVAPLVIEAAKSDPEAARILNKATFELSEHVRALVMKIEQSSRLRHKIPMAFVGSVVSADNVFSRILAHRIAYSLPQITIVKPEAPPAYGAVLLALRSMKNTYE